MRESAAIQFGAVRVPSVVLGIVGSAVAHAAVLAVLYVGLAGGNAPDEHAEALVARGQPILVRLVAEDEDPEPLPEPVEIESPAEPDPEPEPAPSPEADSEPTTSPSAIRRASDWCEETLDELNEAARRNVMSIASRAIAFERIASELIGRVPDRPNVDDPEHITPPTPPVAAPDVAEPPSETITKPITPPTPPQQRTASPVGVSSGAAVIDVPQPTYPTRSIRLGQEGTVEVEVDVRADGTVAAARIATSSGHRLLDRAALDAAQRGRFKPALRNGKPIAETILVPFEFHLN